MASLWKHLPADLPADQQVVWVRHVAYQIPPFLATCDYATQGFVPVAAALNLPWYMVAAWRPQ